MRFMNLRDMYVSAFVTTDKNSNNKMERLNGKIMDREKVFRGSKRRDTPLIDVLKAYYNFTKKHGSLNGRTTTEQT